MSTASKPDRLAQKKASFRRLADKFKELGSDHPIVVLFGFGPESKSELFSPVEDMLPPSEGWELIYQISTFENAKWGLFARTDEDKQRFNRWLSIATLSGEELSKWMTRNRVDDGGLLSVGLWLNALESIRRRGHLTLPIRLASTPNWFSDEENARMALNGSANICSDIVLASQFFADWLATEDWPVRVATQEPKKTPINVQTIWRLCKEKEEANGFSVASRDSTIYGWTNHETFPKEMTWETSREWILKHKCFDIGPPPAV